MAETQTDTDLTCTAREGTPVRIQTTYDHLVRAFGRLPGPATADGKTRANWIVPTPHGEVHVYDWKQYAVPAVEQVTIWTINGYGNQEAVDYVLGLIHRTPEADYAVTPDTFIAAAGLVLAYDLNGAHDLVQVEQVLDAFPSGNLVRVLVQQLATAIRSPKFNVPDWHAHEVERSLEAMQENVVDDIMQRDAELDALGVPEQYRDRLRAWRKGAPVEEILDKTTRIFDNSPGGDNHGELDPRDCHSVSCGWGPHPGRQCSDMPF
jgi:hypothetical protein